MLNVGFHHRKSRLYIVNRKSIPLIKVLAHGHPKGYIFYHK